MSVLRWRKNFRFFFFCLFVFWFWECSRLALLANFRLQALGIIHDSYHAWDSPGLICHGTKALPLRPASPTTPTLCSILCFSEFEEKPQCFTDSSSITENHLVNLKSHWKAQGWVKIYMSASLDFSVILLIKPVFHPPHWWHMLLMSPQKSDPTVPVLSKRKNSVERYTQF